MECGSGIKMKNNYKFFVAAIFLMVFLSFDVLGFAVTAFYWDEKPLYLNPGESRDIEAFGMQNMVGNQDITINVEQNSGFEIAKITDKSTIYEIPFGRKDVMVHMKVTIPEDAKIGQRYVVGASFKEFPKEEGAGNVQFASSISYGIVVVIGKKIEGEIGTAPELVSEIVAPKEEKPSEIVISETIKKSSPTLWALILILILVVIILIYKYESKKNKKVRKR